MTPRFAAFPPTTPLSSSSGRSGSRSSANVNVVPTGFGGTLKAPYARNQGPVDCEDCHGAHASANSFLLATVVNGTVLPPGSIDRAGVGAEQLCNACHQGDRHEACKSCHRAVDYCSG